MLNFQCFESIPMNTSDIIIYTYWWPEMSILKFVLHILSDMHKIGKVPLLNLKIGLFFLLKNHTIHIFSTTQFHKLLYSICLILRILIKELLKLCIILQIFFQKPYVLFLNLWMWWIIHIYLWLKDNSRKKCVSLPKPTIDSVKSINIIFKNTHYTIHCCDPHCLTSPCRTGWSIHSNCSLCSCSCSPCLSATQIVQTK